MAVALRSWREAGGGLRARDYERQVERELAHSRTIDPRVQLAALVAMNLLATTPTPAAVDVAGVAIAAFVMLACRRPAACLGWCIAYALLWLASWLCSVSADPLLASIGAMLALMRKMFVIAMLAVNLVTTTRVGQLACALQRIHVPRLAIVALSVALRFFPTLSVEARSVLDAMKMRGMRLTLASVLRHPLVMAECFMVPLMLRVSVVTDEIARAATVRGIDFSHERSSLYDLRLGRLDWALIALTCIYAVAALYSARDSLTFMGLF